MVPNSPDGTPAKDQAGNSRVIRHAQVREKIGLGRSTLYALCASGRFPKPFALVPDGREVGWLEGDVDAWILARKSSSSGVKK